MNKDDAQDQINDYIHLADTPAKYRQRCVSVASWPNLEPENDPVDENLSLSLRAKLLYGQHSFEDLVEDGSFGSEIQISGILDKCEQDGVLVIHNDIPNYKTKTKKDKTLKNKLFNKLTAWLS